MKTTALFCTLLPALCAAPVAAREAGQQWDAHTYLAETASPTIGDERVLTRAPLFDDAPFLRLRSGDSLVEGRRWHAAHHKGGIGHFEATPSVFLRSDGRLFDLLTELKSGRLDLRFAANSTLFDWDVSLKNAGQLQRLFLSDIKRKTFSLAQFEIIKKAVRAQFPEAVRDDSTPQIAPPALIGPANARRAVFEGLFYNGVAVHKFRLEIGSGFWRYSMRPFLVGPPRVDRSEWDEKARVHGVINGPAYGPLNADTIARKRAAYDKMRAFDTLMEKFFPRKDFGSFSSSP